MSCQNGVWQTVDRFGATNELRKSPFVQPREGMFRSFKRSANTFGREQREPFPLCLRRFVS